MNKINLLTLLLLSLLVGCSDSESGVAADSSAAVQRYVEAEVEYLSIHALLESGIATPVMIQELLDLGVDVNAKDGLGQIPLHYAARYSEDPRVIYVLLRAGASVNTQEPGSGFAPLHFSARYNGSAGVTSVLLRAGADVNSRDNLGGTSLHSAAQLGKNPEVLSLLLGAGADVNAENQYGGTALGMANLNPHIRGSAPWEALRRATNQ